MIKFTEKKGKLFDAEIWRVFISGSSSAGKTYFAKQLLSCNLFRCERIYYYHPDIAEAFPVTWNDLGVPVLFQAGLPSRNELLDIPPYTCIVLDDLYTEACKSQDISYLFRVLSSKKKLHVMIMTQRYFAESGLNIRNSSNFHVLMTNVDVRTNSRVGNIMGLTCEFKLADQMNSSVLYPYIFVDRTNSARVNKLQVYTDIFSRCKKAVFRQMKSYIVSEADFESQFTITGDGLAEKYETSESTNYSTDSDKREKDEASDDRLATKYRSSASLERYKRSKNVQRQIRNALRRHQKYSKL